MSDREMTCVRLAKAGREAIQQLADKETGGDRSAMIRILLSEAITARRAKKKR